MLGILFAYTSWVSEVMVSRMTLILYILMSKNVFFLYEQPGSSLLWVHPRMEAFFNSCLVWRAWTWMGAFGHDSPKGTCLISSRAAVGKLSRALPDKQWGKQMTTKTVGSNGQVSVTGGKDLESSQQYTDEFGLSTLSVWLQEPKVPVPGKKGVIIPDIWAPLPKNQRWEDAELTKVMQFLTAS